ncbi:MAG: nitroreductase family protein [Candidatus Nitrosocosmicus sp.]
MSISVDESIDKENTEPTQKKGRRGRQPSFPINPLILNRWSPRSMTGEELDDETTMSLFDAARWAPSSCNNQPWRFVYAKRNTQYWNRLFDLLAEPNKVWAKNAAMLVVVISNKYFDINGKYSITHQYDAGAAWENLALEASLRELVAHSIQGFDFERARADLGIPDSFNVMAMIAIGKRGPKENLPMNLQEKEEPNGRKPLKEIVMEGRFTGK